MKCLSGILLIALVTSIIGCGSASEGNDPGDYTYFETSGSVAQSGSGAAAAGAVGVGGIGAASTSGTAGAIFLAPDECDGQDFYPKPRDVAVMLLQDLSSSMTVDLDGKPKWTHAKEAIAALLTDPVYKNNGIRFGFDYFPDSSINTHPLTNKQLQGCGVDDPVVVDADINTEDRIVDWINSHEPYGATPLYCAIKKFSDPSYAPKFSNAAMEKYLVIISDGADACGVDGVSNDTPTAYATPEQLRQVTTELANPAILDVHQWDIKTIAIGFGNAVSPSSLNAIADAGGVFDTYIDTKSAEELQAAFKTMGNAVVSCTWDIDYTNAMAEPDKVNFYLDGEHIPFLSDSTQCATQSGWIWGETPNSIELCHEACAKLRRGTVKLAARFGCPTLK